MKSLALIGLLIALPIFAQGGKLEPLVGSAWAKKNPHKLPYSVCHIQANEFTAGIIKNYTVWSRPLTLYCTTRPLKNAPHGLEFRIPLEASIASIGLTGIIGVAPYLFEVSGLDNKSAWALFDRYKGFSFSLGLPALGVVIKTYHTKSKVQINTVARTLYAGLEIGNSRLVIKPVSKIKKKWCLNNKYIIDGEITQARNQKYCDLTREVLDQGQKPLFNLADLRNLKFVFKGKAQPL